MKSKYFFLFLLFLGIKNNAQNPYTLKHCIAYGLMYNRTNVIHENEKLLADAKAKEIISDYLPKINVISTFDNNLKLQQTIIPAGVFGPDEMRTSLQQKYNANTVLQIEQVIFDKSLSKRLENNKYLKEQANLSKEKNQESIIYNVSSSYVKILVYKQQLAYLYENKKKYLQLIKIYELQVKKGIILQKDLDKIVVDNNNNNAQIRVAESNIALSQNQLKYEMGFPISKKITLDSIQELASPTLFKLENKSFNPEQKLEIGIDKLNIKMLKNEQSAVKANMLPKLSLSFQYGAVGFGDRFSQTYRDFFPYSIVGLKLDIPIFNFYRNSAQYAQATLRHKNAVEQLKLTESKYQIEFENAQNKLLQSKINVENGLRNIELAESVFKVTELQFQKSVTSLTEWILSQNSVKEAQNNYLTALYSFYQLQIDSEMASGTLKAFYESL